MTNLDSIFKSRDITLPTKDHLVTAVVFPVVMYGCESLTVLEGQKKIKHGFLSCFFLQMRVLKLLGVLDTSEKLVKAMKLPLKSSDKQSVVYSFLAFQTI